MYRNSIFVFFLLSVTILLNCGCSGSAPGSSSSAMMGIAADPSSSSLYKLSVKPGDLTVGTGKTLPMVIKLTDFSGAPVPEVNIVLNSSLGGTFESGNKTDAGGFIYCVFTAGKNAGTTQISASAFDALATFSLQIMPAVAQAPKVTVFTAAEVVAPDKTVFIQIFIADGNGVPLDRASLVLQSANGATFASDNGLTNDGWFTTTMTAGSAVGQETITAMALGITGTKTISVRN